MPHHDRGVTCSAALACCLLSACHEPTPDPPRRALAPRETCPDEPATVHTTPPFTPGSVTLAVLPDTQVYALRHPAIFAAQTAWIAGHADALDIRYTLHLGDIVNNNTDREWQNAADAMALLDDLVPVALVPGNHDYGPGGDASTRDGGLNRFFAYADTARLPSFGGAYQPGALDNSYHLFTAAGHDWLVLALEWGPRDQVIHWANDVMQAHPDHLGILVTHAYLNHDSRRLDHTDPAQHQRINPHSYRTPGGVNDGEELWHKLVRRHHFVLTLNGHVTGRGTGHLASVNDRGNIVHQMLSNYQMRELGGEGYMRLLELLPDGRTLVVRSYSPLRDNYLTTPDQQMTLQLGVD